jgi:hypothetical protein
MASTLPLLLVSANTSQHPTKSPPTIQSSIKSLPTGTLTTQYGNRLNSATMASQGTVYSAVAPPDYPPYESQIDLRTPLHFQRKSRNSNKKLVDPRLNGFYEQVQKYFEEVGFRGCFELANCEYHSLAKIKEDESDDSDDGEGSAGRAGSTRSFESGFTGWTEESEENGNDGEKSDNGESGENGELGEDGHIGENGSNGETKRVSPQFWSILAKRAQLYKWPVIDQKVRQMIREEWEHDHPDIGQDPPIRYLVQAEERPD